MPVRLNIHPKTQEAIRELPSDAQGYIGKLHTEMERLMQENELLKIELKSWKIAAVKMVKGEMEYKVSKNGRILEVREAKSKLQK